MNHYENLSSVTDYVISAGDSLGTSDVDGGAVRLIKDGKPIDYDEGDVVNSARAKYQEYKARLNLGKVEIMLDAIYVAEDLAENGKPVMVHVQLGDRETETLPTIDKAEDFIADNLMVEVSIKD